METGAGLKSSPNQEETQNSENLRAHAGTKARRGHTHTDSKLIRAAGNTWTLSRRRGRLTRSR